MASISSTGSVSLASQIRAQQARLATLQSTSSASALSSSTSAQVSRSRAETTEAVALGARQDRFAAASSTLTDMRSTLETLRTKLNATRTDRGNDVSAQVAQLRSTLMSEASRLATYGVKIDFGSVAATTASDKVDGVELSISGTAMSAGGSSTSITNVDAAGLAGTSVATAGSASVSASTAGLGGTGTATAGIAATVPSTLGLSGSSTNVAGTSTPAAVAKIAIGTFSATSLQTSDRLVLGITAGGSTQNVTVSLATVTDAATLAASIQTALTSTFGTAVKATSDASGKVYLETLATGTAATLSLNSVTGLDGDGVTTPTLGVVAQAAKVQTGVAGAAQTIGTYVDTGRDSGDRIQMQIAYSIGSSTLTTFDVTTPLAGVTTVVGFVSALQASINTAIGSGKITVGNTGNAITLTTAASLGQNNIWLKSVAGLDGNGSVTATAGLAAASGAGTDLIATAARTTTGSDFAGTIQVDSNDEIAFDLVVDGGTTRVKATKATVEAALASEAGRTAGTGTIATAAQLAKVVARAISDVGVSGVGVAAVGQRLVLSKTTAGVGSISVSNIVATSVPVTASYLTGTDFAGPTTFKDDAKITFGLSVDGATATTLTIDKARVETALASDSSYVAGSGTVSTATQLATVLRSAMTAAGISGVGATASGNRVNFAKTTAGAGSLAVTNVVSTASTAKSASALTGTDFAPTTIGATDRLNLTLMVDGTPKDVSIDRAQVDQALAARPGYVAGSGAIADVAAMAAVLSVGLAAAGIAGITVAAEGQRLRFSKTATGTGSVSVWNGRKTSTTTTNTGAGQALSAIDLAPAAAMSSDAARTASVDGWLASVESAIAGVAKVQSQVAFQNARAETQKTLNARIANALSSRVLSTIDKDMTASQAKLAALQTRQELYRRTISIVNARGSSFSMAA